MKYLILITAFLVATVTKALAQDQQAIRINYLQEGSTTEQLAQKENHQFQIVAKEDVDVNLNLQLKKEDEVNVIVTNERNKVVFSKKFKKGNHKKMDFSMNQNEKYTVKLIASAISKLQVKVFEN